MESGTDEVQNKTVIAQSGRRQGKQTQKEFGVWLTVQRNLDPATRLPERDLYFMFADKTGVKIGRAHV